MSASTRVRSGSGTSAAPQPTRTVGTSDADDLVGDVGQPVGVVKVGEVVVADDAEDAVVGEVGGDQLIDLADGLGRGVFHVDHA